jgi:sulfonate transport system substrate-binding protein
VVTGDLDAFVGSSSLLKLRDKGSVKILYTSKSEPDDWKGTNALIVQEDFLKKYPEITKRFLKRFLLAAQWRSDESHRQESQLLDSRSGTDLSLIAENQAGLSLKDLYNPRFDEAFVGHYKNAVGLAKQQGLIQKEIDVDQWLDRDLLEQALREIAWK